MSQKILFILFCFLGMRCVECNMLYLLVVHNFRVSRFVIVFCFLCCGSDCKTETLSTHVNTLIDYIVFLSSVRTNM
jgi:hypothetical protein